MLIPAGMFGFVFLHCIFINALSEITHVEFFCTNLSKIPKSATSFFLSTLLYLPYIAVVSVTVTYFDGNFITPAEFSIFYLIRKFCAS